MREHGGGLTFPLNCLNIRFVPTDFVSFLSNVALSHQRNLFSQLETRCGSSGVTSDRQKETSVWGKTKSVLATGSPEPLRPGWRGIRVTVGLKPHSFPAKSWSSLTRIIRKSNLILHAWSVQMKVIMVFISHHNTPAGVRHPVPCIRLHAELCSVWEMAAAPSLDWTWQNGGHCFAVKLFLKVVAVKKWSVAKTQSPVVLMCLWGGGRRTGEWRMDGWRGEGRRGRAFCFWCSFHGSDF